MVMEFLERGDLLDYLFLMQNKVRCVTNHAHTCARIHTCAHTHMHAHIHTTAGADLENILTSFHD